RELPPPETCDASVDYSPDLAWAPGMAPDDGAQGLEHALVVLERRRHLVRGLPAVGIQPRGARLDLAALGRFERGRLQASHDVRVARAESPQAVRAQAGIAGLEGFDR